MKRKIIVMIVGSLIMAGGTAHAHCGVCGVGDDDTKVMKKDKKMTAHMDKWHHKLGLSEDQAAKMDAAKQTKMDKIAAADKEYMDTLKSILNEEQMSKYIKMMGDHHGSMKGDDMSHGSMKGSK
ncbi:MAG: hypothetical protein KC900_01860 [Candidatus Omnitrophica bacterium]|nr:hypothetical protein [Candidatus Omnitrophota bacterium]